MKLVFKTLIVIHRQLLTDMTECKPGSPPREELLPDKDRNNEDLHILSAASFSTRKVVQVENLSS